MLRFVNICLGLAVFTTAVWLYHVKYEVRGSVRMIKTLERQIDEVQHDIALLEAEWTYLNRPDRLQGIAEHHLELSAVERDRIIEENDIARTIRGRALLDAPSESQDPIGDILGGIQ